MQTSRHVHCVGFIIRHCRLCGFEVTKVHVSLRPGLYKLLFLSMDIGFNECDNNNDNNNNNNLLIYKAPNHSVLWRCTNKIQGT